MQDSEVSRGERWAKRVRHVLMLTIAAMVVLLLFGAPRGSSSRLAIRSAYAEAVGAAPSMLALILPGGGGLAGGTDTGGGGGGGGGLRFYIVDTGKQVVCVYGLNGDKIRLVSAREYSRDMDILDASLDVPASTAKGPMQIKSFEGTQGIDRTTADLYATGLQKLLEEAEKKK